MKKESGPAIRLRRRHDLLRDGCCSFVAYFIAFVYNFLWKGELFSCLYDVLIPPICYLTRKGCELLVEHKRQSLALLFFLAEAFALYLDICGKNVLAFLTTAYLLSVIVFSIAVQTGRKSARNNNNRSTSSQQAEGNDNGRNKSSSEQAEEQLIAIERAFAAIQMMYTFFHLVLALASSKKINLGFSIFPLVYSAIGLFFAFKYGTQITDRETADGQSNQEQPNDVENAGTASTPSTIFTSGDPVSDQTGDSFA